MAKPPSTRIIGELTFSDTASHLNADSILCLPLGAIEQHGPHLPLNTDVMIAEAVTRRIVARWGDEFDLWQLPTIALGLSREHEWASGTMSLSIQAFTAMMRDFGAAITRALPARNLAIVNGHGGNRGILQNLIYELQGDFGLNVCVIHPLALSQLQMDSTVPEIHAGKDETSVMLAIAPDLVRKDLMGAARKPDPAAVNRTILDLGVTWAWSSGDPRIASKGVTGDAAAASVEFGEQILTRILEEAGPVFTQLRQNRPRPPR